MSFFDIRILILSLFHPLEIKPLMSHFDFRMSKDFSREFPFLYNSCTDRMEYRSSLKPQTPVFLCFTEIDFGSSIG